MSKQHEEISKTNIRSVYSAAVLVCVMQLWWFETFDVLTNTDVQMSLVKMLPYYLPYIPYFLFINWNDGFSENVVAFFLTLQGKFEIYGINKTVKMCDAGGIRVSWK